MFERIPERLDDYRDSFTKGGKLCAFTETRMLPDTLDESQFDCANCSFDMDMLQYNGLAPWLMESRQVKLSSHRFYHHCHSWVRVEEQAFVRIGIDDFGQKILGPIEEIFLPFKEDRVSTNRIRIKARGQIIPLTPPVDGYIEKVNEDLLYHPELINQSPYEGGWLVLLRPTRLIRSLRALFYGDAALQWFDLEMFRLAALITSEVNSRFNRKLSMTLPGGSLPGIELLNELPPCITRRVLEQFFLYCHTSDRFKD